MDSTTLDLLGFGKKFTLDDRIIVYTKICPTRTSEAIRMKCCLDDKTFILTEDFEILLLNEKRIVFPVRE